MDALDLYSFSDSCVLRIPSFPLVSEETSLQTTDFIKDLLFRKGFCEALFLASPVLYYQAKRWVNNELADIKEINKLRLSIYKYYQRMRFRCTPFGLFAGCCIAEWGSQSEVGIKNSYRHSRMDMTVLYSICHQLEQHELIRSKLKYYSNTSFYQVGSTLRYLERNKENNFCISSVDYSPILGEILVWARNGSSYSKILLALTSRGASEIEAKQFLEQLINEGLLQSELLLPIVGKEPHLILLEKMTEITSIVPSPILKQVQLQIKKLTTQIHHLNASVSNDVTCYEEIMNSLKELIPSEKIKSPVQCDLFFETEISSINSNIKKELLAVTKFLNRITATENQPNLRRFSTKFQNRFGDSEIPLLKALDPDIGIGYSSISDLEDGLLCPIALPKKSSGQFNLKLNEVTQVLINKVNQAIKQNCNVIILKDEDFEGINNQVNELPPSLNILFRVLNNQSEKLLFEQCCGPSALNPLTRFSHGNEAILELSLFLSKQEQDLYPGCIIADIVHLPEGNLGNVTAHPHLTKYEIPVLSTSSLDENYQIDLSDLLVSIVNENIVLRSNKLNKTIIPRVSNAHNFSTSSLHVYKFLCDIQVQSFQKNNLSFSWGNISMIFDFLPRVEYRNTILSPAIWFVKRKDIEGLQQHYDSFQKWTIKHGLPDRFILVDNDNEIFIDTNDKMSRALFLDMSAKKDRIVLKEFVFNTDNPLVRDPVGAFTNECLAILYRKYTPGNASGINKDPTERTGAKEVKRSFMPGEEWLYFKIYCGIKSSDAMLRGEVRRIVNQLTEEKLIEQWFFLRHNDPEEHIRIRFRLLNKSSFAKAVQIIQQELKQSFKDGVISNIQLDTYVRELERYGPDTIEITEQIFHIESMLTLDLLDHIKIYNDKKLRWYYSLIAIDSLLNEFGFSNEQKHRLVSVLYHSYFEEHKGDKKLTVSLNDNYRKNRQTINSLIRNQLGSELPEGFLQVLKNRYSGVTPLIQAIKKIELSGKLQVSLNDFISSIVHMLVNRIFICRQRTNEMILYHMLLKFYSSEKFIGQN